MKKEVLREEPDRPDHCGEVDDRKDDMIVDGAHCLEYYDDVLQFNITTQSTEIKQQTVHHDHSSAQTHYLDTACSNLNAPLPIHMFGTSTF